MHRIYLFARGQTYSTEDLCTYPCPVCIPAEVLQRCSEGRAAALRWKNKHSAGLRADPELRDAQEHLVHRSGSTPDTPQGSASRHDCVQVESDPEAVQDVFFLFVYWSEGQKHTESSFMFATGSGSDCTDNLKLLSRTTYEVCWFN